MENTGIDVGAGIYVPVGSRLATLETELKRGMDKGEVFMADSLTKLAKNIRVDKDTFIKTVDRYNRSNCIRSSLL